MRYALCIGFVLSIIGGCNDESPLAAPGGSGGEDSGAGGNTGGGPLPGGNGGVGNDGGGGGTAGGGGEPCDDWSCHCPSGCQKISECNNNEDVCATVLNTNCSGDPPAQPWQCVVECVDQHLEGSECGDYASWFQPNSKPSPELAQCIAACPGEAGTVAIGFAPLHGVFFSTAPAPQPPGCAQQFCSDELASCTADGTCSNWVVTCGLRCSDAAQITGLGYASTAACWEECTAENDHGGGGGAGGGSERNAAVNDLLGCLCLAQEHEVGHGTPVYDWLGTADCSDVTKGHMDACAFY